MKISLKFIKSKLKQEEILFAFFNSSPTLCCSIRFWDESSDNGDHTCIYIMTSKNFLHCIKDNILLPENIVCITSDAAKKNIASRLKRIPDNVNILFVSDIHKEKEWLNDLSEYMQKYLLLEQKLIWSLIRNEKLADILNICEELLDNPIILVDMSMRLLGHSHTMLSSKVANRYWNDLYMQQYVSEELLSALRDKELFEKVACSKKAFILDLGEGPYMTSNVYQNDKKIASMSVFSAHHTLQEEDGEILDQITELLAERVNREQTQEAVQYTKEQQIIVDILSGQRHSEKIVKRALKDFQGEIKNGVRLLKLQMNYELVGYGMMDYVTAIIRRHMGRSVRIPIKDSLVFLCGIYSECEQENFQLLSRQLSKLEIKCGCSLAFYEWKDLYQQYLFASEALKIGSVAEPNKMVYEYKNYASLHRIAICNKQMDIRLLCLPEIWKLYQYDKKTKNELVDSFYYYLIHGKSLNTAARIMNIHKTTLGYRLRKVEEMVALDLNDGYIKQQIIFSCEIIQYIKIFEKE